MFNFNLKKVDEESGNPQVNVRHLAVVSSQVKVDSLRGTPVPPAVTRCERHPNDSSPVPRGEPALLIVPSPAHRLVLLALGHPAFPREAQDVGVAAEDGTMFHGSQHPYWVTRLVTWAKQQERKVIVATHWFDFIIKQTFALLKFSGYFGMYNVCCSHGQHEAGCGYWCREFISNNGE